LNPNAGQFKRRMDGNGEEVGEQTWMETLLYDPPTTPMTCSG